MIAAILRLICKTVPPTHSGEESARCTFVLKTVITKTACLPANDLNSFIKSSYKKSPH